MPTCSPVPSAPTTTRRRRWGSSSWVIRGRSQSAALVEPVGPGRGPWAVHQRRLTMRMFVKWAVVLLVPAVFGAKARPQDASIPRGATVKLLLLRQKSVQKELKLDADVVKKIMEFTA